MTTRLIIMAVPASPGRFIATVAGKEITGPTSEPFFEGCRALLAGGADRKAIAILRHAGSDRDCIRGPLKAAASLTVVEDGKTGPRAVRWNAPPGCVDRSTVEANGRAA